VAASTGDILFFLDSDEALAPEAVANAVRLLEEDPRRGCVHGIFAPQPLIDDGPIEWYRTLHAYRWRMKALGPTPTAFFVATAMPRHVFEEVGPFDTRLRDSEDVEYSERLSALYDILLTDEIVAWHDEEYRLLPLLREQFRRAQLLIPFAAAHRRRPGALRANSMGGVASALLTIGTLPLTLLGWSGALVPVASAFLFAFCDPGLLRVVVRHRSAAFLPQFVACHLAVNASIGLGAATGFVRKLFDRDFGSPGARLQRDAG
jgi:hypothetical protein